ncbi:MAG: hypothetical protein HZA88_08135 [Verrucomicrobia bacterium]|nr:hypothetical protein [Verrucomicrobiota bacterium]
MHENRNWLKQASGCLWMSCVLWAQILSLQAAAPDYFQIQVVDADTGRGVPLVELETVNHLRFITDSAGRVAFGEPGLAGQTVFFYVRSHGYEFPKDGFGFAGTRLTIEPGGKAVIKIKRLNIAERLYRVTGEGIYRDSVLLGEKTPLAEPLGSGQVAGQDSVLAVPYRGKLFWFWGDTNRLKYPLGHFWVSGATSELPGKGGLDPGDGVNLRYFVDADGFSRPMARLGVKSGPVWLDGLLTVKDEAGRERLVAHYAHMKSLGEMLDHGLAIFNDEKAEFEKVAEFQLGDRVRCPHGHPNRRRDASGDWFYFGNPFPVARVRTDLKQLSDPACYEVWTQDGWKREAKPLDAAEERKLIKTGKWKQDQARFQPVDVDSGKPLVMHYGSVCWNDFRNRWIMIAVAQGGGSSFLGEVYYAEAPELTGPWLRAKKILTHSQYTFYNPVQHPFFDQSGGRVIYFEGTYAETFSGNPVATPRYDYNQIMYRLDLADPRLKPAQ